MADLTDAHVGTEVSRRGEEVFSLGPLEFQKIREMVAARTSFSAGRELALALEPSPVAFLVERWQQSTDEARRLPSLKPGLSLGGAHDVRPVVQRAHLGGILQPLELLDVASTARVSRLWRGTVLRLRESLPMLARINPDDLPGDEFWLGGDLVRELDEKERTRLLGQGAKLYDSPQRLLHALGEAAFGGA